ncbi:MAG: Ig-like domain-containing protein [Isosphaeraceae bacterium]
MARIAKLMGRWLRPGNPAARRRRGPRPGLEAMEGRTLLSGVDVTATDAPHPVEVGELMAAKAALKISGVDAYGIQGGAGTFTARLSVAGSDAPVAGRVITFRIAGNRVGTARTDANGVATLSNVRIAAKAGVYGQRAVAVFNGTPRLGSALARGPLTVSRAASSMNSVAASGSFGGSGTFVAKLVSAGAGVQGRNVQFLIGSQVVATATTDSRGFATVAGIDLSGRAAGSYTVRARFGGDARFARSSSTGTLALGRATVTITLRFAARRRMTVPRRRRRRRSIGRACRWRSPTPTRPATPSPRRRRRAATG